MSYRIVWFCLAAASAVVVMRAFAEKPPTIEPSDSGEAAALQPVEQDVALAEILNIRRELGGGVLRGSSLANTDGSREAAGKGPGEGGFVSALRQVSAASPLTPHRQAAPRTWDLCEERYRRQIDAEQEVEEGLVGTLRLAARRLDHWADEFEEKRAFADADRLRALARRLRLEARRHDSEEILVQ